MAQHVGGDVALAAIGVGAVAVFVLGDGVDGQVAPGQVFFQRDVGRGMHGKAVVTPRGFALGARECVLFVGVGVQEDREVTPHGLVALRHQGLGRAAHHHPVAVRPSEAHQGISDCTADQVGFHQCPGTNKRLMDLGSEMPNARKPSAWGLAMLLTFIESKLSRLISVGPGANSINSACSQPMA